MTVQKTDRGLRKDLVRITKTQLRIFSSTRYSILPPTERWHKSFRAARLVDDSTRFVIVSLPKDQRVEISLVDVMLYIITSGLECDGKRYAWLGYTESHLKQAQFVLFREDGGWTADRLLSLLGDLFAVYEKDGYGKYAARLGLSFSSTSVALKIQSHKMIEIPDKRAVDISLTTDGVGMIRESLAKEVRASLGLLEDTTAFQTRLGGIKGVFCAYPDDVFDRIVQCTGKTIAYRQSMYKYNSSLTELEICSVSRRSGRARLCVQFILLLLSLGTPIAVFEELLAEQLEDISLFMQDRKKAIEILESTDEVELDAYGKGFQQELYEMLLAGHDLSEPYLKSKMEQFQQLRYNSLREKLSIDVRNSTRLLGIADEEGVLDDNEVYINLPNRMGVYIGTVAVSRNPAYAVGDIRVLNAVNKAELAHLRNCIVFPTKCQRSIPDTMGGGDLDGDEYWITWDLRLIPPKVESPQERTTCQPDHPMIQRSKVAMRRDAADTFVELRNNGRGFLGELSTYWENATKSNADYAHSYKSRMLVPLIEETLDIAKRGSDLRKLRDKFCRLKDRRVPQEAVEDPLESLRSKIPSKKDCKVKQFTPDRALDVRESYCGEWERYYDEAAKLLGEFNKALQHAITKDKDSDELESVRSGDSGLQNHADDVKQEWVEKYFSGTSPIQHAHEYARASAWYFYGYGKGKTAFAWLGARQLNMMKAAATNNGRLPLPVGNISTPLVPISAPIRQPPHEYLPSPSRKREESPQSCSTSSRVKIPNEHSQQLPSAPASAPASHRAGNDKPSQTDVRYNPKPQSPVATRPSDVSPCTSGQTHLWRCFWANGSMRKYICQLGCSIKVSEKKVDMTWTLHSVN